MNGSIGVASLDLSHGWLAFCFLHRAQSKFYACADAPWLALVHVHNLIMFKPVLSGQSVLSSERNECSLWPAP